MSETRFSAADGVGLGGTVYGEAASSHTALLLNSGTGIPRGFYRRFAEFAASRGFLVLCYDYRGIGDSAGGRLRDNPAVYRDWGQRDLPAALDHLQSLAPTLPVVVVAHSTGGQQLGLSDRVSQVQAALFVAVSTGYWRGMPWKMKWTTWVLWHLLVPLCGALFGYFPARRLGLGEDLPIGVAREWGDWCLEPDYLAAYFDRGGRHRPRDGRPFGAQHFAEAGFAIRSLNFRDDTIATPANVPPLLALYTQAEIHTLWLGDPQTPIGHLGFFRSSNAGLWPEHLDWLQAQAHASSLRPTC